MIKYGVLASKSSEIFLDLLWQLRSLWYSIPLPVLIAIGIFAIVAYFFVEPVEKVRLDA
jgi:hypothetical protein